MIINYLYMNGSLGRDNPEKGTYHVRFASPFIQKRLFNYFSNEIFRYMGQLLKNPFIDLDEAINEERLDVKVILGFYREYLRDNREWLLEKVPRRSDLRIYEAVFHFNLYSYLHEFLRGEGVRVMPEFPTGNGKIDLILEHGDKIHGLEIKSYVNYSGYKKSLSQAAAYGKQLNLEEISLIFFVEEIDDASRDRLEAEFLDPEIGVKVSPVFIETGR